MRSIVPYRRRSAFLFLAATLALLSSALLAAPGCNRGTGTAPDDKPSGAQGDTKGKPGADAEVARKAEAAAVRDLVEQARPLVAECRRLGRPADRVTLLGKALIVDRETARQRNANKYLPEALRGKPGDSELTLFLIAQKHRTLVATYTSPRAGENKKIPGYRVDVDLAIVRWPSKKAIGMVRIKGDDPPQSISVRQWSPDTVKLPDAVTGWIDLTLSGWVASLPVEGGPDPVGSALALADAANAKGGSIMIRCDTDDQFKYEKGHAAPKLKGKVVIWDIARDQRARKATKYLPEDLRGQLSDPELTLFLVDPARVEAKNGGDTAGKLFSGRGTIEGYIVYWPEKKVGGRFTLTCDDLLGFSDQGFFQTDDEGQVAVDPETGLYDTIALKLARWIKGLPPRS
jgi:hypothetical protein